MQELTIESNSRPLQRASVLERTKKKIVDANLVADLIKYCKGELEMTQGQATTALRLIGKWMPDLQASSVEVTHNHNVMDVHNLTARLAALGHDPATVFKRISTGQVIEPEKTIIESDPIEDPPIPDL